MPDNKNELTPAEQQFAAGAHARISVDADTTLPLTRAAGGGLASGGYTNGGKRRKEPEAGSDLQLPERETEAAVTAAPVSLKQMAVFYLCQPDTLAALHAKHAPPPPPEYDIIRPPEARPAEKEGVISLDQPSFWLVRAGLSGVQSAKNSVARQQHQARLAQREAEITQQYGPPLGPTDWPPAPGPWRERWEEARAARSAARAD